MRNKLYICLSNNKKKKKKKQEVLETNFWEIFVKIIKYLRILIYQLDIFYNTNSFNYIYENKTQDFELLVVRSNKKKDIILSRFKTNFARKFSRSFNLAQYLKNEIRKY